MLVLLKGDTMPFTMKEFENLEVVDETDRRFKGWLSVEMRDRQGEIVPIEEIRRHMNTWMKRGAPIMDGHLAKPIGRALNWGEAEKSGKPGIWIEGEIYKDYTIDNEVWKLIKAGKKASISFGGRSTKKAEVKFDPHTGESTKVLHGIEFYEASIVERPANPEATIDAINPLAKADRGAEWEKERKEHPDFTDEQIDQIVADHKKGDIDKETNAIADYLDALAHKTHGKKWNELGSDERLKLLQEDGKVTAKENVDVQKPFADYENFNACVSDQKSKGHDEESAKKICGSLQARTEKGEVNKMPPPTHRETNEKPPKAWWDACVNRVKEGKPDYSEEQVSATCGAMYFHHWGMGKSWDGITKEELKSTIEKIEKSIASLRAEVENPSFQYPPLAQMDSFVEALARKHQVSIEEVISVIGAHESRRKSYLGVVKKMFKDDLIEKSKKPSYLGVVREAVKQGLC